MSKKPLPTGVQERMDEIPRSHHELADLARQCFAQNNFTGANFYATMSVYEALINPAWGTSVGEELQRKRENENGLY